MNLKTTLGLVLVAVAGGFLWFGAMLPLGLNVAAPQPPTSETLRVLADEITDGKISRIEMKQGDQVLVLQKENGIWTLPGKWPTRSAEVKQLVALLTGLESRFAPEAIDEETDLKKYGLDKPGVTVLVKAGGKDYRLAFGEERDSQLSRFAWPTWLRIVEPEQSEVVRLAPGLVAALEKPELADYYQQRRLFPGDRVAKEGEPGEKVDRLNAQSLTVEQKKDGGVKYTLTRDGDQWMLTQPVRDRVDPDKLRTILTAIPDVWAESFVRDPKKKEPAVTGLDKPEEEITVKLPNGNVMTLLVGKVSQTKTRTVTRPAPPGSPFPPQKETVHDEYRYARLKDNDQVFEIQAEKLKEVFPTADTLRDAKLARFSTADALRVEIVQPGQKPIVLTKDKDKNRWSIVEPIKADAETAKVTELLDKLAGMQARDKDVLDKADPKKYGLDAPALVTVKAEEPASGGREPPGGDARKKAEKTFTFEIGKHDDKENRLYVRVKGWDRVNAIEENVLPLVNRPVLAYRGRRIFDFAISDVSGLKMHSGDETLSLAKADGKWSLTEPVKAAADADKIDTLAGNLGNLEAVEYVNDAAKPEDLEPMYGLGKPAVTATLTFADKDKPAKTLLIGKQRDGKDEYFAKLADADSVFAVKKDIRESLSRKSLAYRPLDLWKFQPDELAELRVQKGAEPEYTLTHKEGGWKITAPFQANVTEALVTPMTEDLAKAKADKYAAHTVKEAVEYGLDKPALRLTVVPKKDGANKDAKDRVLLVGNAAKEGGRYAKLADSDAVVIVPNTLFVAADRGALDLLERNLLGLDRDTIEKVQAKVGDARLGLQKQKDVWQVVESPAPPFPADRVAVDALLSVWGNLRAEKFVAYAPKADELPKYGLDKPSATVTVSVPNKDKEESHTLEIGKAVDGSKDRYARLTGRPEVAVLPASAADRLTATYLDYVNRNLFDVDTGAVAAVVRTGKDALDLVKRDDGWHLVKPAELRADDRVVLDLLKQATGRATRVAAYPAGDLKPYGLDNPDAVVTLRVKGADDKTTDLVLKVGKPVEGGTGERFATLGDSKAVLVLPPPLVQGLLAGPLGFRDRNLVKFADADKAVLERGDRKPVTFARTDGTWKLTAPLTAGAEHTELENLVNAVAELRAAELVAEKPADKKQYGLDKPSAHWRFQSGDKDVLNLLVGAPEKNGSRRYAMLQGGDLVFLLNSGVSNKLLAEYRSRVVWSPSLDSAQAEELRYVKGGTAFAFEKSGADWKQVGKPETKVKADAVTETLAAIAGLKAERYVQDKDADFKLYGLDPPELVIEVGTGSGKRTLHVGRTEGESKRYYARVVDKDRSDVFVIAEADAAKIVRDLPAFVQAGKATP